MSAWVPAALVALIVLWVAIDRVVTELRGLRDDLRKYDTNRMQRIENALGDIRNTLKAADRERIG